MRHHTSTAVIEAVADAAGVDPIELPPLYEVVDTDALDRLFDGHTGVRESGHNEVQFWYSGFVVTVREGRAVAVRPAHASTGSTVGTDSPDGRGVR